MTGVFKSWKPLLLIATLAAAALCCPGNILAEPNQKMLGRAVADLTALRDQIADNRALILKGGWNAYVDDKLMLQDLDKTLDGFKPWLDGVPPGDILKVERLSQIVSRLTQAEEAYKASIEQCRNSVAQSLLGLIAMTEMGLSVTSKTDALVLGVKPLEFIDLPSEPHILKNVDKFGFKLNPDVRFKVDPPINAPENQVKFAEKSEITPVPAEPSGGGENFEEPGKRRERPPRLEPSSDPEVLRAAYEAYKAYQLLRFMVKPATYDVQLAMVDLSTLPVNPRYDQNYIEETLDPLRKLPGLTERELKAINDLPKFFQETEDNLKLAREALAQKQLAQADLEELVESALTDIDELRAYYLKRLVDRGE